MRNIQFIVLFSAVFVLFSCKDKNKEEENQPTPTTAKVLVHFKPMWGDQPFVMQQVYHDDFGNRIRSDKFMQYYSGIRLRNTAGEDVIMKDFYLADFYNNIDFEFDVPPGSYNRFNFDIGIPEDYNKDQDPAQYANDHPLSVAGSQGMFWTWNTGYIFLKFEGKADTTGTDGAELLEPVAIHIGDDPMFTRYSSPLMDIQLAAGDTREINVLIHVDQIFATGAANDIDLATDAITHTSNNLDLANQFMENYTYAITVE
ncbi:MAG: hypothetical protein K1X54_01285 [Flavobacteriales bacterium]|nr:hypothetical protein [Flavobacteriales bacterium]